MLKDYPIKINNEAIPFPTSWEENPKRILNAFETEAGGIKHINIRTTRMSFTGEWKVSSRMLRRFKQYRELPSFTLSVYDAQHGTYGDYTVSIDPDSFVYSVIPASKLAENTNGLYVLSFSMEEF